MADETEKKKKVPRKPRKPKLVKKEKSRTAEPKGYRDIGVDVTPPKSPCKDVNCPFHGTLSVRGQIIEGIVVSDRMQSTVTVKKDYRRYIPKYERYELRTGKYAAHNPPCINAKMGSRVKIMECRPLSKTKSFVVIEQKT
ncbi:MAG: 30S ribosomal protein S17 [Thermoplasmata archaeon]|nr:MAG: 30S ribosomal protein S17 [Thermoplasmata archaeon]